MNTFVKVNFQIGPSGGHFSLFGSNASYNINAVKNLMSISPHTKYDYCSNCYGINCYFNILYEDHTTVISRTIP